MRLTLIVSLLALSCLQIGCDIDPGDPLEPVRNQKWAEEVERVAGKPIGAQQVDWEKGRDTSAEEAIDQLRTRKAVLAKVLESPPEQTPLVRRQAMTEAFLLEEMEPTAADGGEIPESQVEGVREEVAKTLTKPPGYVATIVTTRAPDDLSRAELLATTREIVSRLGSDPTDDEVEALDGTEVDGITVDVHYGARFAAVDASGRRPGWVGVSMTGASEVQALGEGERVTSAYTIDDETAQFMVKIAEIPGEEADSAEVDRLVDERIADVYREHRVRKLVDELVEGEEWSIYPEALERDLESGDE